jgi:hypothetical protein
MQHQRLLTQMSGQRLHACPWQQLIEGANFHASLAYMIGLRFGLLTWLVGRDWLTPRLVQISEDRQGPDGRLGLGKYELLRVMVQHAGKLLTHRFLLDQLWSVARARHHAPWRPV